MTMTVTINRNLPPDNPLTLEVFKATAVEVGERAITSTIGNGGQRVDTFQSTPEDMSNVITIEIELDDGTDEDTQRLVNDNPKELAGA